MDGQIVLREYQTSDRPALIGIIRETWQYDKFASPKAAQNVLIKKMHSRNAARKCGISAFLQRMLAK